RVWLFAAQPEAYRPAGAAAASPGVRRTTLTSAMNRTLVAVSFALAACTGGSADISASLAKKVSEGRNAVIDLSQLGPPSWQRVCVLQPYTNNDRAALVLGFKWDAESKTRIATHDGINVLVFVRGTEVVAYTEHPRNVGDLSKLEPL